MSDAPANLTPGTLEVVPWELCARLRLSALAGASPQALVEAWVRELDAGGRSPATLAGHRWHALAVFTDLAASRGIDVDDLDLTTVTRTELVDYVAAYRRAGPPVHSERPFGAH